MNTTARRSSATKPLGNGDVQLIINVRGMEWECGFLGIGGCDWDEIDKDSVTKVLHPNSDTQTRFMVARDQDADEEIAVFDMHAELLE